MDNTTSEEMPVNPTKQHSMKCPKLYGQECKCDGYHTFDELYEHRIALFIVLCNWLYSETTKPVWKSKKHFDESEWEGWFIAGIETEKGKQITYHLPNDKWDLLRCVAYDKAPCEFDGHTSDDVIERLYKL